MSKSLQQLRAEAYKKGYFVDFPGIYASKAHVYPASPSPDETVEVDMSDKGLALQNLDAAISILPNKRSEQ